MMDWQPERLSQVTPEGEQGSARIEHYEVSVEDSKVTMLRQAFNPGRDEYIPPGRYVRLRIDGHVIMSNTDMEVRTNRAVVRQAHGRVLIAGLGLGMILQGILPKPEVTAVSVIECNHDVIALIEPSVRHHKLTVIHDDIFAWKPVRGERFNCIYFDIWPNICLDNLRDIATLHRRFGRYVNRDDPCRFMDSWQRRNLLAQRRTRWR
jgi:hypothetical protein